MVFLSPFPQPLLVSLSPLPLEIIPPFSFFFAAPVIPPSRFGSSPPPCVSAVHSAGCGLALDVTQFAVDGCHVYTKISWLVREDGAGHYEN